MATLTTLVAQDDLVHIDVDLGSRQFAECLILASTKCAQWLNDDLQNLQTTVVGGRQTPLEQIDALFERFVTAKNLNYGRDFWHMFPHEMDVWELKTDDVRIFGWFVTVDIFVCVVANDSDFVHTHKLHTGYVGEVVRFRDALDLDEPKIASADELKERWNIKDNDDG